MANWYGSNDVRMCSNYMFMSDATNFYIECVLKNKMPHWKHLPWRFISAATSLPRDLKHGTLMGHIDFCSLEKLRSLHRSEDIKKKKKNHSGSFKEFSSWFFVSWGQTACTSSLKKADSECFLQSKNRLTLPADGFKHFDWTHSNSRQLSQLMSYQITVSTTSQVD